MKSFREIMGVLSDFFRKSSKTTRDAGTPPARPHKRALGRSGESLAAVHLRQNGYRILCTNYRTKMGEIDIVAEERGVIAFVEVKMRRSLRFGPAKLAVTRRKQENIARTARHYLARNGRLAEAARFDVLAITLSDEKPIFELIRNAFPSPFR